MDWFAGITAAAGAVAAVAGGFAAWYARQAAQASERISRDALQALATTIEPTIACDLVDLASNSGTARTIAIINPGAWPAHEVRAAVTLEDGKHFGDESNVLTTEPFYVKLPDGTELFDVKSVTVTYWDSMSIAQYEWTQTNVNTRYPSGAGQEKHTKRVRLRGPSGTVYPERIWAQIPFMSPWRRGT